MAKLLFSWQNGSLMSTTKLCRQEAPSILADLLVQTHLHFVQFIVGVRLRLTN